MKAKKKETWATTMSKRVETARKTAEKRIRAGVDRAIHALPPAPRKAVKEFTANVDKTQARLMKRAEGLGNDVRKRADGMLRDFNKRTEGVMKTVNKRAEGVLKTVNKRTEFVTATLEKRFDTALKRLTKRLDVASRGDVEKLRKRIEHVEKRLEAKAHPTHHAPVAETVAA